MSLSLSSLVSKCQDCNWSGEPQDIYCSVDKSHTTEAQWAYFNTDTKKYEYYNRPDVV